MAERTSKEKEFQKNEGWTIRILHGVWTVVKYIGKGIWWIAKAWWKYLDQIASTNPQDFEKRQNATSPQQNLMTKKVETVMISGRPYYKDKNGNYRPLDV